MTRRSPQKAAKAASPVRLRYLWDSQTVLALGPQGEVLAAAPVARLIVEAPRRKSLLPRDAFGYELASLRDAVVAEAQLAGKPAPAGWAQRIHGKAVHTSNPREGLGLPEAPMPRLPKAGPIEDADADD